MRFCVRSIVAVLSVALLASCGAADSGSNDAAGQSSQQPDGRLSVVASTNVWGDIAAQIGGDHVTVTSLIDDPSQDPHTFQPSGRDELAVSRASVVIVNGGGYDDFLVQMLASVGKSATVITATTVAAKLASFDPDNEHLWLNVDAVRAVADAIADAFAARDPATASAIQANAKAFDSSLDPLRATMSTIASRYSGTPVAVTEPLPDYLLHTAGLANVTPPSFTEAMEEGVDVSPSDLATVLALFSEHRVKLLVYNEQSASGQAQQVLAAAHKNQVPVMSITELLPSGEHYQQWIADMVHTLRRLLGGEAAQ